MCDVHTQTLHVFWRQLLTFGMIALCTVLFAVVGLALPVHAACPAHFAPGDLSIFPDDNGQVLMHYSESERLETLVIQPEFTGTATEFGLVMPVPNRPEINEAPEDLFELLTTVTTVPGMTVVDSSDEGDMTAMEMDSTVTVIMEKDVGDFKTTVLVADRADDLTDWLNDHGFEFGDTDTENFDYYITKGGYYFVALKVNMDKADVDARGQISGRLNPIEFVFESEHPMLPLRIMSGDAVAMKFTVYTLGDFPYYIRGVDVDFANPLTKDDIDAAIRQMAASDPEHNDMYRWLEGLLGMADWRDGDSLSKYEPVGKWLVRMTVWFDPGMIESNLLFDRADPNASVFAYHAVGSGCQTHTSLDMSPIDHFEMPGILENNARCSWHAPDFALGLIDEWRNTPWVSMVINPALPAGTHNSVPEPSAKGMTSDADTKDRIRAVEDMGPITLGVVTNPASVVILLPDFEDTVKPLKQLGYGIPPGSIACADGMQLVFSPSERPACVTHSTVSVITEYGWDASTVRTGELERLS